MEIKIGTYHELGKVADELRRVVFIYEQGIPEEEIFDGLNLQAIHIVVFDGNAPVATARVLNESDNWRIGLVAVDKSRRGQHLGEKLCRLPLSTLFLMAVKKFY